MVRDFERAAARAGFILDDAQMAVAARLDRLSTELGRKRRRPRPRGLYLWGPVGRGKSWLITTFFENSEAKHKRRVHFHEFFRQFHDAYSRDPGRGAIDRAVDELLGQVRLLCFDEFHVHDPGDAMLIARLLRSLFDRGIVLVTSSNYPPEGLLPNPIHHHLFEPAIAMLGAEMDIVELSGGTDYRGSRAGSARSRFEAGTYLWPGSSKQLRLAGVEPCRPSEVVAVMVNARPIRALAVREELVWFDFHDLCATPTAPMDYLALTERHATWVISGVPALDRGARETAQRFGNVIDVLCDRDIRLILVGSCPLDQVLGKRALPLDADRIRSRLSLLAVDARPSRVR